MDSSSSLTESGGVLNSVIDETVEFEVRDTALLVMVIGEVGCSGSVESPRNLEAALVLLLLGRDELSEGLTNKLGDTDDLLGYIPNPAERFDWCSWESGGGGGGGGSDAGSLKEKYSADTRGSGSCSGSCWPPSSFTLGSKEMDVRRARAAFAIGDAVLSAAANRCGATSRIAEGGMVRG